MPVTRLIRLTIMLAVLLAPLAMIGGGPARAAAPHEVAPQSFDHSEGDHSLDAHCAGMAKNSKEQPRQDRDCMVACAAIIPMCSAIDVRLPSPAAARTIAFATSGHGLEPEAETPPPRLD
jgi:hypothetical protein